jgi:predicted nucleic acid-binding protein
MKFWDSSAILPLILQEAESDVVRELFREDPQIVTWGWTRVELTGAVERRAREGGVTRAQRRELLDRIGRFAESWDEVTAFQAVRTRAIALLARHPLRGADAGQLGAALLVAEQALPGFAFVSLDRRQSEAAEREGLRVLPTSMLA